MLSRGTCRGLTQRTVGYWGFAVISLMRELAHTRAHTCVQAHVHMHALANSYKARTPASCMHIAHVHTYLHTPTGTRNLCVHTHTGTHAQATQCSVYVQQAHACTHMYAHIHRGLHAHRHDCASQALLSSLGRCRRLIGRHQRGACFGQVKGTLVQGAVTGPPWSHSLVDGARGEGGWDSESKR